MICVEIVFFATRTHVFKLIFEYFFVQFHTQFRQTHTKKMVRLSWGAHLWPSIPAADFTDRIRRTVWQFHSSTTTENIKHDN